MASVMYESLISSVASCPTPAGGVGRFTVCRTGWLGGSATKEPSRWAIAAFARRE